MGDVYINKIELPMTIKGVTILKDGDYIVFINNLFSDEIQEQALKHELDHIYNDDLYCETAHVNVCEFLCGQY